MTREEAIKELELIVKVTMWNDRREAVEMAIEALKAQDRPIICPRCGRTFSEAEGREINETEQTT